MKQDKTLFIIDERFRTAWQHMAFMNIDLNELQYKINLRVRDS